MNDKIFRIIIISWLVCIGYITFNDPNENNSQEKTGVLMFKTVADKKLDYLWDRLPEKERCRFESENGLWRDNVYVFRNFVEIKGNATSGVVQVGTEIEVRLEQCKKWLEKTESKYLIP